MTKAILNLAVDSRYDDLPEERYHFPRQYLRAAEAAVGDWIIYYRPKRGASARHGLPPSTYFAVARLESVEPDESVPGSGHFYARIGGYLDFDVPVSIRREEGYYETGMNQGLAQNSIREVSEENFSAILSAGLVDRTKPWQGVEDAPLDQHRPLIERITSRPYRDGRFRDLVRAAYADTCAISGLSLRNGGGRPEVQAAHIKPVKAAGPDSVRNGLALSGTVHWLFDRGLVSLDDDYRIIVSRRGLPTELSGLVRHGHAIRLPEKWHLQPDRRFLSYHREQVFHR